MPEYERDMEEPRSYLTEILPDCFGKFTKYRSVDCTDCEWFGECLSFEREAASESELEPVPKKARKQKQ